jgi:hypothetical protein
MQFNRLICSGNAVLRYPMEKSRVSDIDKNVNIKIITKRTWRRALSYQRNYPLRIYFHPQTVNQEIYLHVLGRPTALRSVKVTIPLEQVHFETTRRLSNNIFGKELVCHKTNTNNTVYTAFALFSLVWFLGISETKIVLERITWRGLDQCDYRIERIFENDLQKYFQAEGFQGSIPGRGSEFFSSPSCPERLWGPPSLPSDGYRGFFARGKAVGAWSWPLTCNQCKGQECVELYLYSPIRLQGVVLS